jgi:hypothetical protein
VLCRQICVQPRVQRIVHLFCAWTSSRLLDCFTMPETRNEVTGDNVRYTMTQQVGESVRVRDVTVKCLSKLFSLSAEATMTVRR